MRISVVLPLYNGRKYITEQLDSLKIQTLAPDEVLMIDDDSSDDTVKIVTEYIDEHDMKGWSIIRNGQNMGWKKTFWRGLTQACGDVIFLCDQDDIWHKDKIDHMMRLMDKYEAINVLKCANPSFSGISDEYKALALQDIPFEEGKLRKDTLYRHSFNSRAYTGCTMCVRKNFIDETAPFWNDEFCYDSYLYRMSVLKDSMYIYDVPMVYQRVHEDNATKRGADANNYDFQKRDAELKVAESLALRDYAASCGQKVKLTENNYKWSWLRNSFYQSKKIIYALRLIRYLNYYPGYRTYFLDLKYIYGGSD